MSSIEELLKDSKFKKEDDDKLASQKLAEKLQSVKLKEIESSVRSRANELGYSYINLQGGVIVPEALAIIPKDEALSLQAACFLISGGVAHIGAVNPETAEVQKLFKKVKEEKDLEVKLYLISEPSFEQALKLYEALPRIKAARGTVGISEQDLENFKSKIKTLDDLATLIKKIPLTEFMAFVIAGALQVNASDIHLEGEEKDVKIRYRIDGILHNVAALAKDALPKIISRIKLLSGLKLNITDKPQDGRFTIFLTNDRVEVRVSVLPTSAGENVVMRLLLSSATGLEFEELGLRGRAFELVKKETEKPNGMILTTGPTGSGKTTTLYAILNKLNKPDVKIITIEDPIEYKLEGITQSQVNPDKGYTFANSLRSIVRQDPDVIMVGEIRDLETAEIAIDAALTGHLVVSTLHTNNAAGAIPRLLAIGVKPFSLSPAINTVIGQRLCRRICQKCKVEDKIDKDAWNRIKEPLGTLPKDIRINIDLTHLKFYKGKGCDACNGIGYKGRVGIFEVLVVNERIEKMISSGEVNDEEIQKAAVDQGMITMVQDGLLKALDGATSVEEVKREVGL